METIYFQFISFKYASLHLFKRKELLFSSKLLNKFDFSNCGSKRMHFLWGQNVPYVTVPYVTRHFRYNNGLSKKYQSLKNETLQQYTRLLDIYPHQSSASSIPANFRGGTN